MEKITITPQMVRGLGDIAETKTTNDYTGDTIHQTTSIIGGVETPIFSFNNDNLTIVASNPYMMTGETTDLTITLKNGLGEPLPNKTVTVTGTDSSSYSGITNNAGVFVLYDMAVSADTTFTATYSTVSDSILVEYCDFVDYAVTNKKNTDWLNYSSRLSVSTDENGTLLTKGASNGYYLVNNSQIIYEDYICEFDIVDTTGQVGWYHQASSNSMQDVINFGSYNVNGKHIKLVCEDGVMKVYADGTQIGSNISLTTSTPFEMGFRINAGTTQDRYIKYKNFRLHTL